MDAGIGKIAAPIDVIFVPISIDCNYCNECGCLVCFPPDGKCGDCDTCNPESTTEPPTTQPPTTPPTTAPPTTATQPPTTQPPTATQPPTTEPPTEASTEPPSEPEPTTRPNIGESGGSGSSSGGDKPEETTEDTTEETTAYDGPGVPGKGGTDKDPGDNVVVKIKTNNETGKTDIDLDKDTTDKLIQNALDAAKKEGGGAAPVVTLDLMSLDDIGDILTVSNADAFGKAGVTLVIELPNGITITLTPEALKMIAASNSNGSTPVTIAADNVPMKDLKGLQAAQVKGYETVINLDVFVGGEKLNVPLTVSVQYKLKGAEKSKGVSAWRINALGMLEALEGEYDEKTGIFKFKTEKQSLFVIGYDIVKADWDNIFTDVRNGSWYYDAAAFANYYKMFDGYGDGIFAPNDTMTRAMFIEVLWKLDGRSAAEGKMNFNDVPENRWYYKSILWAETNGIIDGIGVENGQFAPERSITRQEMAAILYNYAVYSGYEIPEYERGLEFDDADDMADWAAEAIAALVDAGVFNGMGDDNFAPEKDSTRAEVAQMFMNFLRLVVNQQEE